MLSIVFLNDDTSHTPEIGNYVVHVYENKKLIATSRIENHNRADGWRKLVRLWIAEWEEGGE